MRMAGYSISKKQKISGEYDVLQNISFEVVRFVFSRYCCIMLNKIVESGI